jgi:hypothetical protein
MADASDKPEQQAASRRKPAEPGPAAVRTAEQRWEQEKKDRKLKNPVIESYYELHGSKLLLCKAKKTGSVYRVLVGSTDDKQVGSQIREQVKKLQAEKRIKIRV